MDVETAYDHLLQQLAIDRGRFYGPPLDPRLGAGLIFSGIRYPAFALDDRVFDTHEGVVYVLTHECDIDPHNDRFFSEDLLVCPLIDFQTFVSQHNGITSDDKFSAFLSALSRRRVFRVMYFPPICEMYLPYGGLAYLNDIASTHKSEFEQSRASLVISVSSYGLWEVDQFIQRHFFRPKELPVPLDK